MNFNEIVNELSKNYELKPKACNVVEILINKLFDAYHYYFLAIKNQENHVFLTDYANTLKVIEIDNKKLTDILTKYNATLNDETIIMEYENLNSVKNFILMLDEIAKN